MSDALLIAAHGSRDETGVEEFHAFARAWQALRPDRLQESGFLEFARPTIAEAVDSLVDRGARRITVAPAMLMAAGHVKNDVPGEIADARLRHPGMKLVMARALDVHPSLLELCHVRYREAIEGRADVSPQSTALLLVGRGTTDPDANANIARIARFLWESYGVAFATVAFSGLAQPGVDEALTLVRKLGFSRVVVQPYLLFDGVLLKRVHEAVARQSALDPAVEIVAVDHLRLHPLLLQAFEDRAHEAIHGTPNMNCDLCKYRVKLIGREGDRGAPQVGHHHHARATMDDPVDDHDHRRGRRRAPKPIPPTPASADFHPWDARLLERLQLVDRA